MRLMLLFLLSLALQAFAADPVEDAIYKRLNELPIKNATTYDITQDITENNAEQAAVSAFSWGGQGNQRNILGGALRGYSLNTLPTGVWGADIFAMGGLHADVQLVGAEIAAYQRNNNNRQVSAAINTIFGNRVPVSAPPPDGKGANRYNEFSMAWFVSAQPRSSAGEYSGWQTAIKLDASALDRTLSKPYASFLDASEVAMVDAPWYLVVYKCGAVKCGLKITDAGIEVWRDIDGAPAKLRTL